MIRNDPGADSGVGVGGSRGGFGYQNADFMGNPTYLDARSNLGYNANRPGTSSAGGYGGGVPLGGSSWPTYASTLAQVFTSIYGANAVSSASEYAARLQAQSAAAALAFAREQAAADQVRFEQTQRANYDQWSAGTQNTYAQTVAEAKNARAAAVQGGHNAYNAWSAREGRMGQLGEILGLGPRYVPKYEELPPLEIPALNIPPYAGPGSTGTGGTGGASGTPDALRALLMTPGLSPQEAARRFNQQFGRTTGNEAVWYPDSNAVSIPEGKYYGGPGGWVWSQNH